MSKQTINHDSKARVPLFLFLMGTLAFSLSTLPTTQAKTFTVTSLSSEFASDCSNMVNSIDGGANRASCGIDPVAKGSDLGSVKGHVDVELATSAHRDPRDVDKIVSTEKWKYTLNVYGSGDPIEITGWADKEDYKSITAKVMKDFNLGATKMAARLKQAKIDQAKAAERQAKHDRCETEVDPKDETKDRKITDARKKMDCHIARLDDMDEDEAADHYEKNILPEIESMVSSNDVRKQRQGMALLKQLNGEDVGGQFVKESIADLAKFGQFKYASDQQKLKIMAMDPNDPTRPAMVQQMRLAQFQADSYFQSRGLNVQNQSWPTDGFDFGTTLTDNLTNFQNRLDQNYAALLQQHQFMLQNPTVYQQNQQQLQQQQVPQQPPRPGQMANTVMQPAPNAWPGAPQQTTGIPPQPIQPNQTQANPAMMTAPVNNPQMANSQMAKPQPVLRPLSKR